MMQDHSSFRRHNAFLPLLVFPLMIIKLYICNKCGQIVQLTDLFFLLLAFQFNDSLQAIGTAKIKKWGTTLFTMILVL